jgi:hypothetical protein
MLLILSELRHGQPKPECQLSGWAGGCGPAARNRDRLRVTVTATRKLTRIIESRPVARDRRPRRRIRRAVQLPSLFIHTGSHSSGNLKFRRLPNFGLGTRKLSSEFGTPRASTARLSRRVAFSPVAAGPGVTVTSRCPGPARRRRGWQGAAASTGRLSGPGGGAARRVLGANAGCQPGRLSEPDSESGPRGRPASQCHGHRTRTRPRPGLGGSSDAQ